jgi:hypothetical protein
MSRRAARHLSIVFSPPEEGPIELSRLRGRQARVREHIDHFVGEVPLVARKRRRTVPAQSSSDVLMHGCLRASDLVCAPMQLLYLLEQRLEHLVVDRHEETTLLAPRESLPAAGRRCEA